MKLDSEGNISLVENMLTWKEGKSYLKNSHPLQLREILGPLLNCSVLLEPKVSHKSLNHAWNHINLIHITNLSSLKLASCFISIFQTGKFPAGLSTENLHEFNFPICFTWPSCHHTMKTYEEWRYSSTHS